MPAGRTPSQILILVNVTFPLGLPQYKYLAFADGSNADKVAVAPGDQVGWFVRVQAGSGWSRPAYTLTFNDASVFGTGSISVPAGGPSGYFTVLVLSGMTKYTLAVSGVLPPSDPMIQVDPNGNVIVAALGAHYSVRWTSVSNLMEFSKPGGGWLPFPADGLEICPGDAVQFSGVLNPPPDFEIEFPSELNSNNLWSSPFNVYTSVFVAQNLTTGSLTVADKNDPAGTVFQFRALLTDGSVQSAVYKFVLG